MAKKLINLKPIMDSSHIQDLYLIVAANIEASLIEAGAESGRDYSYVDLYQIAMPFVLEEYKEGYLKTWVSVPKENKDDDENN